MNGYFEVIGWLGLNVKKVLWLQVCGLASVQGAIALTWVIYNLYLVKLLTQFGFPASLAMGLLILENILAVLMEPLMGSLSDRQQRWLGTRFPLISIGVVLASACFIAIPVYIAFSVGAIGSFRWIFPVLFVAWALAMTVFRSPVLSLLGQYAFNTQLPQAASILTLVGGLAGAMGPLAGDFILAQGPILTFTVGSITLLVAATVLRLVKPESSLTPSKVDGQALADPLEKGRLLSPIPVANLVRQLSLVFGCGVGISLGFRLMMLVFPQIIEAQVPQANVGLILGGIFLAIAVTAIPAGFLASRWGNIPSMAIGLGAMALLMGGLWGIQNGWLAGGVAIALGSTFSVVSNGTIPFALTNAPPGRAALGTGMYFSGGALANSLFGALFGQISTLSPTSGALLGAAAFLAAGVCVVVSDRLKHA